LCEVFERILHLRFFHPLKLCLRNAKVELHLNCIENWPDNQRSNSPLQLSGRFSLCRITVVMDRILVNVVNVVTVSGSIRTSFTAIQNVDQLTIWRCIYASILVDTSIAVHFRHNFPPFFYPCCRIQICTSISSCMTRLVIATSALTSLATVTVVAVLIIHTCPKWLVNADPVSFHCRNRLGRSSTD